MQTIGDNIKTLRLAAGLSQTQLAEQLEISNQAVSKWETNVTMPDITLLPPIATIFGVSIDALFDYTKDKMYEKISSQLESGYQLSHHEFQDFERFLLKELQQNPLDYRANHELGVLYYAQGNQLRKLAVTYAKKALDLKPNTKYDINIINNASDGVLSDWDTGAHHDLITYYQQTLKTSPENKRMYWYLLDNLIADGRLREARAALAESYECNPDHLNHFYDILITEKEKSFSQVKESYLALAEQYSDDWRVLFSIANEFCRNEDYRSAIPIWEKAFEAQEKPRYTDYHESIALCYIRLGEPQNAIKAYQKVLNILQEEWDLRFGAYTDQIKDKIKTLSR